VLAVGLSPIAGGSSVYHLALANGSSFRDQVPLDVEAPVAVEEEGLVETAVGAVELDLRARLLDDEADVLASPLPTGDAAEPVSTAGVRSTGRQQQERKAAHLDMIRH